jgi:hypothetical protein
MVGYFWVEIAAESLREIDNNVHEVKADPGEIPLEEWDSVVNQVWFAGEVMKKLADMFAAKTIPPDVEFVVDTNMELLVKSINMLSQSSGFVPTMTHWNKYAILKDNKRVSLK